MNSTPNSNRKHIAIYGKTNAGKSSLINCLLNQEVSLVSETRGTTTDPVSKAMELIPVGPVLFIDTAGLDDKSKLGEIRVKKTLEVLKKTDIGLYVMDINDLDIENYNEIKLRFKKYNIPYITVINKVDTASVEDLNKVKEILENVIFLSSRTGEGIEKLKEELIKKIELEEEDSPLVGDLLPYNSKVILVVPIDSEAPKGRLILPQVQCIRDCLDHGIKSYVVRDTELESALEEIKDVDLVITDSQAFKNVDKIVPRNIKLTSFSILFARQKGDLDSFVQGAKKIEELNKDSKILISESCSHNISHEDIGRFKIPKMLNKYVGAELNYEFRVGSDFPEDIKKYDLIIHCGACMINRKTVINRINYCKENNVAITNYGVVIAYLTGILKRTLSIY
ncbi:[FeFe] hydrogenase H-cluster maturation GTPase HydF [Clostridium gasigenes]|uniref:[FeFe] hydrogenase H-cluster maturation GTPase HydF n=1 Tax=Clostridium gasigenes TaxID=94869 RepID=UPI001C0E5EFF|nr:[FeFe] hydrogenase H-cluster maturation GTPase HydF [Clostridium gasigenes]MBU3089336.1 [FeFe] hydrogenase H-cluster maturation GTPase HydF [Clostridium gasigenes]